MSHDDATQAQNAAANPEVSTWLSANAGSGKTRVLTDRVARLLLRGANPQNILCLTYTKAAAGEMQNRLFKGLGRWAMLSDAKLREALEGIGEEPPEDLSHARTLFARAVETPGGLKIQTIHSFCSTLLRQFPLEAGVAPGFRELDESGQIELLFDLVDHIAETNPGALQGISEIYSGETLVGLARGVASARNAFATKLDRDAIWQAFHLHPTLTAKDFLRDTIDPDDIEFLKSAALPLTQHGSANDKKLASRLLSLSDAPRFDTLRELEHAFLYGEKTKAPFGPKTGTIPTKPIRETVFQAYLDRFNALIETVADARPTRVSLEAAMHTEALHRFAQSILPAYTAAKIRAGVLDFDDLIERAGALLSDRSLEWVLFRLDGRIDHILVDEAQDTSPAQWAVIETLAEEIAAGQGSQSNRPRSLFVVGDKKQSIYSFQGADAQAFNRMEDHFRTQMGNRMAQRELLFSFRSSRTILDVVDATLSSVDEGALGQITQHRAFHEALPGRVDLWDLQERDQAAAKAEWYDPIDRVSDGEPAVILADAIADKIHELLETGSIPDENGTFRRIEPGDFLILVQRRSTLFDQIIRACKARDLQIAGADRLKINAALAVKDLTALLSFLALPEDDLSLAAALRSPLFGWSEQEVFTLASGRGASYLWTALREKRATYAETVQDLDTLRRLADFERPYELLETILSRFGGRQKLTARLGPEAEDGIDALLSLALKYEQGNVPTLTGFLAELAIDDVEIKRATDTSEDLIRVMTIHGAKGLEAPIVILPDTIRADSKGGGDFVVTANGLPVWSEASSSAPAIVADAMASRRQADRDERLRLLYVAMTRARTWLMVCGVAPSGKLSPDQWHPLVKAGLETSGGAWIQDGDRKILRLESGGWPEPLASRPISAEISTDVKGAGERLGPVPAPPDAQKLIAPSDLGGAKALPGAAGLDEDSAKKRGHRIHRLLEHLPNAPREDWPGYAAALLVDVEDASELDLLLEEASACIHAHPDIFAPDTLTEVDFTSELPSFDARLAGTIDRLIISDTAITVIDYKTNATRPQDVGDTPEGILRQLGAYYAAVCEIWPQKPINLVILWTVDATAMAVPHDLVTQALQNAAKP